MPGASEARSWVHDGGLHGIGDSLYTPFSGPDGDEIDYDSVPPIRAYCVGDLGHDMLWLTSGIAEWWSLTMDERKKLTEIAIEEARAIAPATVIQACTTANSAKEALELTRHAQEAGADICYLQTPPMELHGGEGVLRFVKYIADRTDDRDRTVQLGVIGIRDVPQEVALIAEAVPAVCAIKEGTLHTTRSKAIHRLAPDVQVWECDLIVYHRAGIRRGSSARPSSAPAATCTSVLVTCATPNTSPSFGTGSWPNARVRKGSQDRSAQRGHRFLVHELPRPTRILHALGICLPLHGRSDGPAARRLPRVTASARNASRRREATDRASLRHTPASPRPRASSVTRELTVGGDIRDMPRRVMGGISQPIRGSAIPRLGHFRNDGGRHRRFD